MHRDLFVMAGGSWYASGEGQLGVGNKVTYVSLRILKLRVFGVPSSALDFLEAFIINYSSFTIPGSSLQRKFSPGEG